MLAAALATVALAAKPDPRQFLRVDARDKVATVTLIGGYDGTNNGFNFDGYARGELLVSVPRGWLVRVTCTNRAPIRHSCAVVQGPRSATPAFRGATIPSPVVGLMQGKTARFAFRASRTGVFRFACLVPGHEAARMYDVLQVTRSGRPYAQSLVAP